MSALVLLLGFLLSLVVTAWMWYGVGKRDAEIEAERRRDEERDRQLDQGYEVDAARDAIDGVE